MYCYSQLKKGLSTLTLKVLEVFVALPGHSHKRLLNIVDYKF